MKPDISDVGKVSVVYLIVLEYGVITECESHWLTYW